MKPENQSGTFVCGYCDINAVTTDANGDPICMKCLKESQKHQGVKNWIWTPEKLAALKKCHSEHVGKPGFWFDDHMFNTRFAWYLIEYLESQFRKGQNAN